MSKILSSLLVGIVRVYQYALSPYFGHQCRFTPTCSHYAIGAISTHGPFRGSWLAGKRLSKCHPWHEGGYDPVPEADSQHP